MSYRHLTMDERNVIYRMQLQGYTPAEIARCLGRIMNATCPLVHAETGRRRLKAESERQAEDQYLFPIHKVNVEFRAHLVLVSGMDDQTGNDQYSNAQSRGSKVGSTHCGLLVSICYL